MDGDGIVSFADLNAAANAAVQPPDSNSNGFTDCQDLLASPTWADGADGPDPTGFIDDLCGWNFALNNNNPMPGLSHGTFVAGVVGAVGNNMMGVAGTSWAVSIVPTGLDRRSCRWRSGRHPGRHLDRRVELRRSGRDRRREHQPRLARC